MLTGLLRKIQTINLLKSRRAAQYKMIYPKNLVMKMKPYYQRPYSTAQTGPVLSRQLAQKRARKPIQLCAHLLSQAKPRRLALSIHLATHL